MILLAHWGGIEAFKPPVHTGELFLAEMMAEKSVPPMDEPAGEAWDEASSLTDQ